MGCVEERLFDLENFKDPILGYRALLDVESFVVYFLLTELSNNVDSYRYSTYLHKHASGKLQGRLSLPLCSLALFCLQALSLIL